VVVYRVAFASWPTYHVLPEDQINFMLPREIIETRNAWQSLAYSPLGAVVSPPSEY